MDVSDSRQTAHSHRSGYVSSTIVSVCTGRRLQYGRVRGAGASKTSKRGVKQRTVISKICTNCRFGILSEFLGVNVQVSERFGACPPLFTGCGKATHNITYKAVYYWYDRTRLFAQNPAPHRTRPAFHMWQGIALQGYDPSLFTFSLVLLSCRGSRTAPQTAPYTSLGPKH